MGEATSTLEQRVRLLEDRWELQQLFAAFGPRIDSCAPAEISDFFTEDGVYQTDVMDSRPATGKDAIARDFDTDLHHNAVAQGAGHITSPVHIVIDGGQAEAFAHTFLFLRREGQWMLGRVAANRFWCERAADGWRIRHRTNRMLGSEEARALLSDGAVDLPWIKRPVSEPPSAII